MRELVEYVARHLVTEPDAVRVSSTERGSETTLELRVAKADLGRVIGKEGRTAKAIRAILSAAAAHHHRRAVLEIVEDPD